MAAAMVVIIKAVFQIYQQWIYGLQPNLVMDTQRKGSAFIYLDVTIPLPT